MFGSEDASAVVEVVGGVDDGDGGGVGEGAQGFGDVGGRADAEGEVAGVGAAEGFGFACGVELGEVDFEEVAFGVPADGVDLVAEVESGEAVGDPAAVGVVFGAVDVELLGEVEGEEPFLVLEVAEKAPGAGRVGEGDEVGEEGDLEGGSFDEESGVPAEVAALVVEGGGEFADSLLRQAVGEGREGQVEGADPDSDEVVGGVELGGHRWVLPSRREMSWSRSPAVVCGLSRVALSHRRPSAWVRPRTARPWCRRVRRRVARWSSSAWVGRKRTVVRVGVRGVRSGGGRRGAGRGGVRCRWCGR